METLEWKNFSYPSLFMIKKENERNVCVYVKMFI